MNEEIVTLYKKHKNYSAVGRRLGISRRKVWYVITNLRDKGVDLPVVQRHTAESKRMIGATNKARNGEDFYKRIGAVGGRTSRTGGFHANRELARKVGAIGGRISRRRKAVEKSDDQGNP